jgi:hypothetical protein
MSATAARAYIMLFISQCCTNYACYTASIEIQVTNYESEGMRKDAIVFQQAPWGVGGACLAEEVHERPRSV